MVNEYAKAHYNLGNVYAQKRDFAKAIECFKKAIELDPDNERYREFLKALKAAQAELSD